MALERFVMTTVLYTDATGPFTVVDTAGSATVFATGLTLIDHTGKMVLVTDTGGKRAWGILSSEVSGNNVYLETLPLAVDKTFCEIEDSFDDSNIASISIVISTPPFRDIGASTHKAQVRTEFDGGYVQSRAKYTRKRDMYDLAWKGIDADTLEAYIDFFDDNQGDMFLQTRPVLHTVFVSRFAEDKVTWAALTPNAYSFTAKFEEV